MNVYHKEQVDGNKKIVFIVLCFIDANTDDDDDDVGKKRTVLFFFFIFENYTASNCRRWVRFLGLQRR
jgi:hypothetical protein